MNVTKLNWPLIVLVAALLALTGCRSDSNPGFGGGASDVDGDIFVSAEDNCPNVYNPGQEDTDGDGQGNACDSDADGDGVADVADNCPTVSNTDQADIDSDGVGDLCDTDTDSDGDGFDDAVDNCPVVANPGQEDTDGDGTGDACDPDADGDTVLNAGDNCPLVANQGQSDVDGDGLGDACDSDADGDTVLNGDDNCPLDANLDQADGDLDGIGDVCDGLNDVDGDGVGGGVGGSDNCPLISNPDQADTDGDGTGDACDPDNDNDGILDIADNCPLTDNSDQADVDGDGVGDACDLVDNATYACAASGEQFIPLLAPNSAASETSSGCLLCDVTNLGNLTDANLTNAATLVTNLNVAGYVAARVEDGTRVYPANNVVGIAVSDPGNALSLDLLNGITIATYLDGSVQESNIDFAGLGLDIAGLLGSEEVTFLTFQTSRPFNGIEIRNGALMDLLSDLNVHAMCASPTDVVMP